MDYTMADENEQALDVPADDGLIDHDAPVAEDKPEPKEEDAKPEPEGEEDKPEGEEKADDKPKKPSGAQRAKWREQQLIAELADRDRKIEELRKTRSPAPAASDEEKEPREEDFNGDFFAYQQAATAYKAGKAARDALRSEFATREAADRQVREHQQSIERRTAHLERVEAAREVIADYDTVMDGMKGVNVNDELIHEIMSSDKSALLAYHLAQNPHELHAMNAMSPRELARSMGRLEATLTTPAAKKQTSAPTPLSSVKGGAAPSSPERDLEAWLKQKYG